MIYYNMWDDCRRKGCLKWLGYSQKNILFLCPKNSRKVSIWFDEKENRKINSLMIKRFNQKHFVETLERFIRKQLLYLKPFLLGKRELENSKEIRKYFAAITDFWSVMTMIFDVPNLKGVSSDAKMKALKIREYVEKYSDKIDDTFIKFLVKKFPKNKNLSYNVSISETIKCADGLLSKIKILEIKNRRKGWGLFNGKLYLKNDLMKELKRKKVFFEKEDISLKTSSIHGMSACKGWARGNAQLILFKKKIFDFKKGKILVAAMTSPDFLPAIKKSKAIITDEGGVTCHAAIVSRELHIPCIIGTRIATKIIKDGDLVELDANKGVVKILKRGKE